MAPGKTDAAAEVQRLQQQLARLRQKDIRQEHQIRTLTEQLHHTQLVSPQVCTAVMLLILLLGTMHCFCAHDTVIKLVLSEFAKSQYQQEACLCRLRILSLVLSPQ